MAPLSNPLCIAVIETLIASIPAAIIGILAARLRFSAGRNLRVVLDLLFLYPLLFPEFVLFIGSLFQVCNREKMLLCLAIPQPALVLLSLPVYYFGTVLGFRKISPLTLDAARMQGLGSCGIFWRIFFPAAWRWMLAGLAVEIVRFALYLGPIFHQSCR